VDVGYYIHDALGLETPSTLCDPALPIRLHLTDSARLGLHCAEHTPYKSGKGRTNHVSDARAKYPQSIRVRVCMTGVAVLVVAAAGTYFVWGNDGERKVLMEWLVFLLQERERTRNTDNCIVGYVA
jgi:hypothetical protein